MPELTLESLAQRVAALEQQLAFMRGVIPPSRDWRSVVGIFERTEFSMQMEAEMQALRQAERKAAREGTEE